MTTIETIQRAIIKLERTAGSPVAIRELRPALADELPGEAFDAAMLQAFRTACPTGGVEVNYVRCDPATHTFNAEAMVVWPTNPPAWINYVAVNNDNPIRSK